jgi:hypothetical protein
LVDFWAKVGTISTAYFADMLYKLSCPFSEKAPIATDIFLHNLTAAINST